MPRILQSTAIKVHFITHTYNNQKNNEKVPVSVVVAPRGKNCYPLGSKSPPYVTHLMSKILKVPCSGRILTP